MYRYELESYSALVFYYLIWFHHVVFLASYEFSLLITFSCLFETYLRYEFNQMHGAGFGRGKHATCSTVYAMHFCCWWSRCFFFFGEDGEREREWGMGIERTWFSAANHTAVRASTTICPCSSGLPACLGSASRSPPVVSGPRVCARLASGPAMHAPLARQDSYAS